MKIVIKIFLTINDLLGNLHKLSVKSHYFDKFSLIEDLISLSAINYNVEKFYSRFRSKTPLDKNLIILSSKLHITYIIVTII